MSCKLQFCVFLTKTKNHLEFTNQLIISNLVKLQSFLKTPCKLGDIQQIKNPLGLNAITSSQKTQMFEFFTFGSTKITAIPIKLRWLAGMHAD